MTTLKAVEFCETANIILKTGSPYGTIDFDNENQSKLFLDNCLTI